MNRAYNQVKEFMQAFGQTVPPVGDEPILLDPITKTLRISLIAEELQELREAVTVIDVADAITDLRYVILGTFIAMGVEVVSDGYEQHGPFYPEFSLENEYYEENITRDFEEAVEALNSDDMELAVSYLVFMLQSIHYYAMSVDIPLDDCMDEVHFSNMSKLGDDGKPIYRDDGKVLKGPNYFVPDLKAVLFKEDYVDEV